MTTTSLPAWLNRLACKLVNVEYTPPNNLLPHSLMAFIWYFLRQVKVLYVSMLVLEGLLAISVAVSPWYVGRLIDILSQSGTTPQWHMSGLIPHLWLGLVLYGIVQLGSIVPLRISYGLFWGPRFAYMVRRQAHHYTLRHSMSFFHNDFAGRIGNKTMESAAAMRNVLRSASGAIWYIVIFVLIALGFVGNAHPLLLIPIVTWLALYVTILVYFVPKIKQRSYEGSEIHSHLVGRVIDAYTNIGIVKLFARTNHEDTYTLTGVNDCVAAATRTITLVTVMQVCLDILNFLLIATTGVLGITLCINGAISVGTIVMVLPLVVQFTRQSGWIMNEVTAIFEDLGRVEEGMTTIAKPHGITDVPNAKPLKVKHSDISLNKVAFHYGKEEGVIGNLSLTIPAGQKVGIVGRSGAGKSTLVNLLLRYYDVESGTITVAGQNIAHVTQESLRQAIGVVTQDSALLHRSLLDNIRYGRPDTTMEEVVAAAKLANAHDFILTLEDKHGRTGYEALVGERGVKLSGGQRQRIALARVILENAPILILDEATSALDSETEVAIQKSLETLMDGKTVIAIAHRLSTLLQMDRIIVMDQGQIVEDGTHAELLAKGGIYADLWLHQSGGFLLEEEPANE